ncbi:uncharacterized protein KRP23_12685 [Phytophthora ramorum]|uniref:uncharacterized protein n=1 Tax=Phytophthora ramorum TaxID=164328 RepID=UPI0030A186F0|nr:hypothetical protein KRP23_12685 [Phytophthora ramorum]
MWFASEVAHSTFTTSTRACTDITHQNNEPAKRFLRTDQTVEKGEDSDEAERLYIPGLETATNYLKSMIGPTVASPKQLKAWLVGGESSDDVFEFLKLDQAGDNLLTNPNLDGWVTSCNRTVFFVPVLDQAVDFGLTSRLLSFCELLQTYIYVCKCCQQR